MLVQHQAITWTNVDLLTIVPIGAKFNEIWIRIQEKSFMKLHLKMPSVKWQTFIQGGDELYKTSGPHHSYTTIVSITYVIAKHHKNIQF